MTAINAIDYNLYNDNQVMPKKAVLDAIADLGGGGGGANLPIAISDVTDL